MRRFRVARIDWRCLVSTTRSSLGVRSEHHFFNDMAVTPAPECLFTAVAMRTSRIRLHYMSCSTKDLGRAGRVLSIVVHDFVDEAITLANEPEYGLAAGVWSQDNQRALQLAARFEEFTHDNSVTVDMSGDLSRRAYGLVLGTPPSR